ncbi:MAG: extracellular solute-binding protein [Gemmatimonadetes bacterium]|jgi:arabinosaccharide transport system substrate-binding protein|nr:extracellular solute-binding protein [Gemmatimonadota bacterium]MDE0965481.1 extracellular solute-binding protein [Candidatus Latescibacterota bacterium]MBT5329824.1 extracellular solute-binding protein [Gemmatimonadota bacterium]MBT5449660.1 extracellular solute-binding protein [Gemmatimonadota bacterium]MBT5800736.1 extracellular solute-binding protein [Gemmatimonadota bacterium]|tara:strand:- start:26 stop:1372 length:1347 start_codon:yes stop_codon:yes gene_type:complete
MADRSFEDMLPFGKAPALILLITVVAGFYLALHPVSEQRATMRFWTFARNHSVPYQKATPSFEAKHPGTTLDVQLVHGEAVTSRLRAAFWADLDVPDLVEVEISRAGSFFRGPPEDVGFIDLMPFLRSTGYYDRIVKTRFAPYTNKGKIYGLPHDVHPVMLAYRRDLFEAAGIDVEQIKTWEDFVRVGQQITVPGERYMIELSDSGAHHYEMFLFQRDGGYFDAESRLTMDDETALETLLFFIPLVAGEGRIASDLGSGRVFTQAVEQGYFLSFVCPDWRSKVAETDIPRMHGKMALMPLPAAVPGGRRTSTWGGTMLGITKACPNPELAWQVAEHMYFDKAELAVRFRETNILPPLKDAWEDPAFDEERAYWSGQPLGRLYANLADEVPPQYASPLVETAKSKMSGVISACAVYYRENGEAGFEDFARTRLAEAAAEVRRYMRRNPY